MTEQEIEEVIKEKYVESLFYSDQYVLIYILATEQQDEYLDMIKQTVDEFEFEKYNFNNFASFMFLNKAKCIAKIEARKLYRKYGSLMVKQQTEAL